jgi:hypothetical protein
VLWYFQYFYLGECVAPQQFSTQHPFAARSNSSYSTDVGYASGGSERIGTGLVNSSTQMGPNLVGGLMSLVIYFHKIWTDDLISNFIIYIYTHAYIRVIYIYMYVYTVYNKLYYVCIYIYMYVCVCVCVSVCVCVCAFNYSICLF